MTEKWTKRPKYNNKGTKKDKKPTKKEKNTLRQYLPHTKIQWFWVGATLLSVGFLYLSCALVYIAPTRVGYLSLLPLSFPIWLIGTLLLSLLLLLFSRRLLWIPLLGVFAVLPFIRTYAPINLPSPAPKKSMKVMSWNVFAFWSKNILKEREGKKYNSTVEYIAKQRPDIVCLQEAYDDIPGFKQRYLYPVVRPFLPYHHYKKLNGSGILLLSHYPIIKSQLITQMRNNGVMAYWLKKSREDTVIVINAHLKSMGLTGDERQTFHNSILGKGNKSMLPQLIHIVKKLKEQTNKRADMAQKVNAFIKKHKDKYIILCGDFNDTPISYTRYKLAEDLIDAYRTTGNGIGRTFHKDGIYVRIDHLFCSRNIKPFECYVDTQTQESDHYPITAHFKLLKETEKEEKKMQ